MSGALFVWWFLYLFMGISAIELAWLAYMVIQMALFVRELSKLNARRGS